MITLTFRPLHGEAPALVRGVYFRICADGTLRGPDNAVAANYAERRWQLGPRPFLHFECTGPIYLRVTDHEDRREHLGPFEFLRAAEGAIFSNQACLGIHAPGGALESTTSRWREVTLLAGNENG